MDGSRGEEYLGQRNTSSSIDMVCMCAGGCGIYVHLHVCGSMRHNFTIWADAWFSQQSFDSVIMIQPHFDSQQRRASIHSWRIQGQASLRDREGTCHVLSERKEAEKHNLFAFNEDLQLQTKTLTELFVGSLSLDCSELSED